ncbi:MAG: flippase [Clostridia bacterium]|nr:flippase [Clostridia bacterium]
MDLLRGKIFKNASWIIVSKLFQSVFSLTIGLLSARYLGPSNYGLINYASSIVTFVFPIAQLGLNNTLVHELSQDSENEGKILGTSIIMSVVSALFCMFGVTAFAAVSNNGDRECVLIVSLYSIGILFQSLDLIRYWFQTKLLSKYSSVVSLVAYTVVSLYKLFLLITKRSIFYFAVSNSIDYFLIALLLIILYKKLDGQSFSFDFSLGKRVISKSKHYIIPGLMVAIFAQTDKIMLKSMIGEAEIGYYSAATAIASISSFVFTAIIDSFRPVIFSDLNNEASFRLNLRRLYCIIIWLSLLQSVFMTIFSDLFVYILYGSEYAASSNILRIVVWLTTFSYFGAVRNIWILAKNKQKYLWIINALGACMNVVLNLIMIPFFGAIGAAIASVFTQMFTNFILGFILTPIRENNSIVIESLNPKLILDLIKKDK